MKKFYVIILVLLAFSMLTACGNNQETLVVNTPPTLADPDTPLSGNLTVSLFDSLMVRQFVEEAANLFTSIHTDVTITVESFSSPPEMRTVELEDGTVRTAMRVENAPEERRDFINQVSTDLMGGRGADILGFNTLPFHRYAQQGHLVDLTQFMNNDPNFNINDYKSNILDVLTTDNGLFMLPLSYSFNYLVFDSTLFSAEQKNMLLSNDVHSISDLLHATDSPYQLMPSFSITLLNQVFSLYRGHFIDIENRTANFTDGVFEELITAIKHLNEAGELHEMTQFAGAATTGAATRFGGQQAEQTTRYYYKINPAITLFNEFNRDDPDRFAMSFGSGITDDDLIAGLLSNSRGDVPFFIGGMGSGEAFGINSNSQNQALAWEFIKFMSSTAMMELLQAQSLGGIPLHIGAFEEYARRFATNAFFGGSDENEILEMDEAQTARFNAYVETVLRFSNLLNTFNDIDELIDEMVLPAINEFFEGSISAEDLAQNLQGRVSLILNE